MCMDINDLNLPKTWLQAVDSDNVNTRENKKKNQEKKQKKKFLNVIKKLQKLTYNNTVLSLKRLYKSFL